MLNIFPRLNAQFFIFLGGASISKEIDVVFDDMQWLLTQNDGQLGIANVFVKKFRCVSRGSKETKTKIVCVCVCVCVYVCDTIVIG